MRVVEVNRPRMVRLDLVAEKVAPEASGFRSVRALDSDGLDRDTCAHGGCGLGIKEERQSASQTARVRERPVPTGFEPARDRRIPAAVEPLRGAVRHGDGVGGGVQDEDGFRAFYRQHRDALYRVVAVRLGDARLAEEAVDEAFVRAAERWPQVAALGQPAGWVYRVAINWATSWRRKLARRPTRTVEALDQPHRDRVPDIDLVRELARLPEPHRDVLVLRYGLGLSVSETASALGVTEGTIKSRSARARERMIAALEVTDGHA